MATTLSAQNTYSLAVRMPKGTGGLTLTGTWAGTISLQYSTDNTNWYDTGDTYTANGMYDFNVPSEMWMRAGFKTGDYTSGSCAVTVIS